MAQTRFRTALSAVATKVQALLKRPAPPKEPHRPTDALPKSPGNRPEHEPAKSKMRVPTVTAPRPRQDDEHIVRTRVMGNEPEHAGRERVEVKIK